MAENAFAGTVAQLKREISTLEAQLARARNALKLLSGGEPQAKPAPSGSPPFDRAMAALNGLNEAIDLMNVTDALVKVVKQTPGLTKAEVVRQAVPYMATISAHPRKTAAARLGQLLRTKGRLVLRDGKVYPVG